MNNYEFTKSGIKKMYENVIDDCFEAMDKYQLDKMNIKIRMGDHEIEIPANADTMEIIFTAIEECEKEDL